MTPSPQPYRDIQRIPDWLCYFDESITFLDRERQDLMARFDDISAAVARMEQASADAVQLIFSVHDELAAIAAEDAQLGDLAARLNAAADRLTSAKPAA